jgi:hypothetical protein
MSLVFDFRQIYADENESIISDELNIIRLAFLYKAESFTD